MCGEFRKDVETWYNKYPDGGFLHIVLDDDNMDDESIIWCVGNGRKYLINGKISASDFIMGMSIIAYLLSMDEESRSKIWKSE